MNIFSDNRFYQNPNTYNNLIQVTNKDYTNFKNLFISIGTNIIDTEFQKIENPKKISVPKNESNLIYINKLFKELLSLFTNKDNFLNGINNNKLSSEINENSNCFNSIININNEEDNGKFLNLKRAKNIPTGRLKQNSNSIGIHSRNSEDNMMRKIKNKAIESAYRLINYVFEKEKKCIKNKALIENKKNTKLKICKIAGVYSQELHLTFNLWFILQKLKDIFSFQISCYYTKLKPDNNKIIINAIYNTDKDEFVNCKKILDMTFFDFYHKIFLNENEIILKEFGIDKNDYSFISEDNNKDNNLNENDIHNNDNEKYKKNLEKLANNYEKFFLEKKGRNSNKIKEDEVIKNVIENYKYNDLKDGVYKMLNFNLKNSKFS